MSTQQTFTKAQLDEATNRMKAAYDALPSRREVLTGLAWTLAALVIALAAIVALTGCGIAETDRHPAPAYVVKDCRAALRLIVTDQGAIPSRPKVCDNISPRQYAGAVADVTRPYRITAAP